MDKFGTRRAVNGTVHTASSQERFIGSVHNGINPNGGNIAFWGKDAASTPGQVDIQTPRADLAATTSRFKIAGAAATVAMTLNEVNVTIS